MDPTMGAYFSFGWDATKAYHICMIYINESLKRLKPRMQEPHALYEPIPTQVEFISYLQWPYNKPFYYE